MFDWLVPLCVFFPAAALYLGGMSDVKKSSGVQQILGLLVCLVLFTVAWGAIRMGTASFGGILGRLVLPSLVATALLPLIARIGFRVVGSGVEKAAAHH